MGDGLALAQHLGLFRGGLKSLASILNRACGRIGQCSIADRIGCPELRLYRPSLKLLDSAFHRIDADGTAGVVDVANMNWRGEPMPHAVDMWHWRGEARRSAFFRLNYPAPFRLAEARVELAFRPRLTRLLGKLKPKQYPRQRGRVCRTAGVFCFDREHIANAG